MLDPDENLTAEEITKRFRKVFGREMTAGERKEFFFIIDPAPQIKAVRTVIPRKSD